MAYTRDQIIDKVCVKMDELTPFSEELIISSGNDGVLPIKSYIESILNESTREHLRLLPLHKIPATCIADYSAPTTTTIVGLFAKSADYIKNYSIKFTSWKRAVAYPIGINDPKYNLQGNVYAQGKPNKPVVVELANTLEAYTITIAESGTFKYVKYIVPESFNSDETIDNLCWLVASKVLAIMGDQKFKVAQDNYQLALQS